MMAETRRRSKRYFATHQDRLSKDLAQAGITTLAAANRYILEVYLPRFDAEFSVSAREAGSAFIAWQGDDLDEILCEQHERTVGADNGVHFARLSLQMPADRYRCHYVRAKVRVHVHADGRLALFHGPRKLADYNGKGELLSEEEELPLAA